MFHILYGLSCSPSFCPMGSKVFRSATPLRVRNGQLVGARANLEQNGLSQNGYGNFFIAHLALQDIDQDIRKFLLRPSGKHIVVQPHGNAFACMLEALFCSPSSVVTSSGSYGSCKTRLEVPNGFRCKYRIFVLRSSFFLVVLVFSGWPRWSGMVFSCQFSQFPALQHGNFRAFRCSAMLLKGSEISFAWELSYFFSSSTSSMFTFRGNCHTFRWSAIASGPGTFWLSDVNSLVLNVVGIMALEWPWPSCRQSEVLSLLRLQCFLLNNLEEFGYLFPQTCP